MSAFSIIPRFPLGGKMGERSLYETATQEVNTMYNDEFNNNDMYRFTNREVPRDDYSTGVGSPSNDGIGLPSHLYV